MMKNGCLAVFFVVVIVLVVKGASADFMEYETFLWSVESSTKQGQLFDGHACPEGTVFKKAKNKIVCAKIFGWKWLVYFQYCNLTFVYVNIHIG